MKFVWLLERSMWGIISIRWYALFSDLSKISISRKYQRELQEKHKKEIADFIKNDEYKFFPEVILWYTLQYNYQKKNAKSWLNPIQIILDWWTFISNVNWVKITLKSYKSIKGIKTDINTKIVIIDTKNNKNIFSRIDWNHRLSAYEKSDWKMVDLNIPFSLVLFNNDLEWDKTQKIIFNNINSKVVPLTSEENLKNIIDNDSWFLDNELKKLWDEYLFTRKLLDTLNLKVCSNIQHFFKNKERTILKELSILLLKEKSFEELDSNLIIEIINNINAKLLDKNELFDGSSYSILIALIYFYINWEYKFNIFYRWIINNHIYSLKKINHYDLVEIFKKVMEAKKKEIFLSMPFNDTTKETYEIIKQIVDDINREEKLNIRLREIRLDNFEKWYSYAINEEIYTLIESSWLLIADLSWWNINVYNELWYLMWLNKWNNISNNNFILICNNKSWDSNKNIWFNIKNIKQYRFDSVLSLKNDLKNAIKKYYGLI